MPRSQERHPQPRRTNDPSRPERLKLRPGAEPLERRDLLAADGAVFAHFTMAGATPSGTAAMAMHVGRSEFTFAHRGVLLGLTMQAPPGSTGPVVMALAPQKGSSGRMVFRNPHPSGGATDVVMVRVGPGTFGVQSSMPDASGPMELNVYLVGDANGDHRVDGQDLRLIRSLIGRRQGQPGYSPAADPDGDGVIDAHDWSLARGNLGASTRVRPLSLTAALDPSSSPDGNGFVISPNVTISGQTAPGATVRVDQGDTGTSTGTTTADAQGHYQFQVSVGVGVTPFHVEANDAFGQRTTADTSVTRGDVIIAWNQTMLDAIRATKDTLGTSTRTMAMVQAAMYDAVNAIDRFGSVYKVNVQAPAGASPEAAASEAAYRVLSSEIPSQSALYHATLARTLAGIPDSAKSLGIAVGDQVAAGMLAWRANDGSDGQVPYVPGTAAGHWRPTAPDYTVAWGPEWGQVTPFAIPSPAPFLPPPPPALDSPEYAAALQEVKSLGARHSTTRTADQTQIANFWGYDVGGVGPPPVLYNQITQAVALQQHNTLDQDARLFALVNVAMGDAGVVAWDAKYAYNLWRPVTAIQQTDPSWTPLGAPGDGRRDNFTPPFPSYVSGHATFGAALFTILADFYGTDQKTFTLGSDELPGVSRTYTSFSAAALENAESRIYLGIHFQFDATAGIAAGNAVGNYVFQHVMTSHG
jgi:hypothetical protein